MPTTSETPSGSVADSVTVTFPLFHPAALGTGTANAVVVGGEVSGVTTVVVTVAVLLDGSGSRSPGTTDALFVIVPADGAVTRAVRVALALGARSPKDAITPTKPACGELTRSTVPWLTLSDVALARNWSMRVTSVAQSGPWLTTVSV